MLSKRTPRNLKKLEDAGVATQEVEEAVGGDQDRSPVVVPKKQKKISIAYTIIEN